MQPDLTAVLNRITFEPERTELREIPWPDGMRPTAADTALNYDGSLPQCDVLVITWTAAEARALADVLTPGAPSSSWTHYGKDFPKYKPQLTNRSPARDADRLGEFHMAKISDLSVCCFHSQLHPATDGPTLPAAQLARQVATETGARLVITTGTAGGGPGTVLGDVNVATAIHADCTTRLAGKPWSKQQWATSALSGKQKELLGPSVLPGLLAANAGRLPKQWTPRALEVVYGHCVSVDYFAFYSDDDHYGLLKYDPQLKCEEMDDFAIADGVLSMPNPPMLASVRNASDPPMADGTAASKKLAEQIYQDWGYTTTVGSAITCWALVAGLGSVESNT
jgi:nucleoside phosphorylase